MTGAVRAPADDARGAVLTVRTVVSVLAALVMLAAAGCSTGLGAGNGPRPLVVLGAASLAEPFEHLVADFEDTHPDIDVRASYAGSSTIVQQVSAGAPADVIALASEESLQPLPGPDRHGEPVVFATNELMIATPAGNPAGVTTLADLADPGLSVVVCAPQVPCGAAARELFDRAGMDPHVVSEERDVRAALTKVQLDEADAALVYASDVRTAGDRVHGVPVDPGLNVTNRYPILAVSDNPDAEVFIDFVLSAAGREHLAATGLGAP